METNKMELERMKQRQVAPEVLIRWYRLFLLLTGERDKAAFGLWAQNAGDTEEARGKIENSGIQTHFAWAASEAEAEGG